MESLLTLEVLERYYQAGGPKIEKTMWEWVEKWASEAPDRLAVIEASLSSGRKKTTYRELLQYSTRVALKLLELGISPGDRVAFQMPNVTEQYFIRLGCIKIGAVMVPLAETLREYDLVYILNKTKPRLVFIPASFHDHDYIAMYLQMRLELASIQEVIVVNKGQALPEGMRDFEEFIDPCLDYQREGLKNYHPEATDIEQLVPTSGTTGRPKIVMQTSLLDQACLLNYVERAHLIPDDIILAVTSMNAGLTGAGTGFYIPFLAGATVVVIPDFDPGFALEVVEKDKVTVLGGVPPVVTRMVSHPEWEKRNVSSLRRFCNAGGPTPAVTAQKLLGVGCITVAGYGTSEGWACVVTFDDDPQVVVEGKVGKPLPGFEVRVADNSGEPVAPGEIGEIIWRTACAGYYEDPELNKAVWDEEGWLHSGDMGMWDSKGNLAIVGRKTDMILRGAQNISPREIEEVLFKHPKIADIAVVGMPDRELGEKACAFVVLKQGETLTLEEMQAYLAEQKITKYKWPERLEFIDKLPLSAGGKVAKTFLKEIVANKLKEEEKI